MGSRNVASKELTSLNMIGLLWVSLLLSSSLAAKLEGDVIPLGDGVNRADQQCQLVKVAAEDRQDSRCFNEPECEDVCSIVDTQVCTTIHRQHCAPVTKQHCTIHDEPVCDTSYERQCQSVPDTQCDTVYEQACRTVTEEQCSTVLEQQCKPINEKYCEVVTE